MLISIVVPVFNSTVVGELASRIDAVFAGLPDEYELILVDDCSPASETWTTLERLASSRGNVTAIQLSRNFGTQAATLCGLGKARGEFAITMDDDLQHRPEDIPKFLELRDFDIVIGQFTRKQHNLFKRVTSHLKGYFDQIIVGKPKHLHLSPFRMLSRTVVDGVVSMHTPHPFLPALMFHVSKNVTGVQVAHDRRKEGKGGFTLVKQIRLFSNLIINNSSLILRVVGYIGISFSAVSFVYALVVIYRKLVFGYGMTGWPSLFAAILLIGGLMLFSLGVVGEYLIRIIETSEARPTFFVRRVASRRSESGDQAAGRP